MVPIYLPTIDHSLWPCAVLLVVFVPVSVWHEVHWRRVLAEYAVLRREAGAAAGEWPTSELRWVLSLQPWLILFATILLGIMVAIGGAALLAWPNRLPNFNEVINYYDRPYLGAMLIAGAAAVVGGCALAIDLERSPWKGVARLIRRAPHGSQAQRDEIYSAALKVDPGVLSAQAAAAAKRPESGSEPGTLDTGDAPLAVGDDLARPDVLDEPAVGDLDDAVGPLGD